MTNNKLQPLLALRAQPTVIYSPVRLITAIGVMSGAHYRTSIQELLHMRLILTNKPKGDGREVSV